MERANREAVEKVQMRHGVVFNLILSVGMERSEWT